MLATELFSNVQFKIHVVMAKRRKFQFQRREYALTPVNSRKLTKTAISQLGNLLIRVICKEKISIGKVQLENGSEHVFIFVFRRVYYIWLKHVFNTPCNESSELAVGVVKMLTYAEIALPNFVKFQYTWWLAAQFSHAPSSELSLHGVPRVSPLPYRPLTLNYLLS